MRQEHGSVFGTLMNREQAASLHKHCPYVVGVAPLCGRCPYFDVAPLHGRFPYIGIAPLRGFGP